MTIPASLAKGYHSDQAAAPAEPPSTRGDVKEDAAFFYVLIHNVRLCVHVLPASYEMDVDRTIQSTSVAVRHNALINPAEQKSRFVKLAQFLTDMGRNARLLAANKIQSGLRDLAVTGKQKQSLASPAAGYGFRDEIPGQRITNP